MSEQLVIDSGNYTINAISFILDEAAEKFNFVKMLKQLGEYAEIDLLRDDCHFAGPILFNGDYRQWLEYCYIGVNRYDENRDREKEPADFHWYLTIRKMQFKISKKMALDLLIKDMDYWKEKLSTGRGDFPCVLSFFPLLDLTDGEFKITGL